MSDDSESGAVAEILLPLALEKPYSYKVPADMDLVAGDYVRVPLGPRSLIGVIWAIGNEVPKDVKLRAVAEKFDLPAMPETHRRFIDWLAGYYLQPSGAVLRLCLRAAGVFETRRQRFAYQLGSATLPRLTPQRQRVLETAANAAALEARDLAEMAGVSTSVVKALAKAGALEQVALPPFDAFPHPEIINNELMLSTQQEEAATELRRCVAARDFSVTLLDGVTGSGKTEVYFEAMAACLAAGKQALLLLPEIALTGPFIARVEKRFSALPGEWHSDLRPRERERVWTAVARGEVDIVVGARSALFLPWRRLGLIVVDEEHEPAFKQEDGVAYHVRDMAVVYGALGKFPVVLSSATPSLETLVNVDRGRYGLVKLQNRHGRAELPDIELVDLRQQPTAAGKWISEPLKSALIETLCAGDQALLFLNRRGYAPLTLCRACGHRLNCPDCSTWLVEHRFRQQLQCHQCGHTTSMPDRCPACEETDSLTACGPGVERLAEEAAELFPDARIAVLSSDLQRGALLKNTLSDIARGAYNLIIGTQLVAKGHHFPHLTLAGIVDADLALETTDPRAGERCWQLLAQVAGRTGRGDKPGRALIQTYLPDHILMRAIAAGDRDGFLAHEKHIRQQAGLPPYGNLAGIVVSATTAKDAENLCRALAQRIPATDMIEVFGPAPAPLAVLRGRHRYRFLVKCARETDIQAFLTSWLSGIKPTGSCRLSVNVDPYSFL